MDENILQKLDQFFIQFKHQTYKKGEMLIRADEPPTGVFYLKKGTVKQYTISKKGEELIVNLFKPIAFFPMSWAINNSDNKFYFEATENVEIYKATKEEVVNFIKQNPDVLFDLISRVYRGTDGLLSRMVYLMSENAYDRLVTELIIYAQRFGIKQDKTYEIKVSEKDLAAFTGMTRETVSREIKIMKNKGLVEFNKNNLIIHDLKTLENELN